MAFVESLPRDRVAEYYGEPTVLAAEHLIRQVNHFYVQLHARAFAEAGKAVEECRVLAAKEHRYHIPPVLHCLLDERLLPVQVPYELPAPPGAEACWEGDDLVFRSIRLFDAAGVLPALRPVLVDGDEDGLQVGEVEEKVVHQVPYVTAEAFAYDGREADAVKPAQRVVGCEDVPPACRDGRQPTDVERQVEVPYQRVHEVRPLQVSVAGEYVVHLLLVDGTLDVPEEEAGYLWV